MQANFTRPKKFKQKSCLECLATFEVSEHVSEKRQKKFCNSSCSASFNNKRRIVSDQQKIKTRNTIQKKIQEMGPWGALRDPVLRLPRACAECNIIFTPLGKNFKRQTCSKECYKKYQSKNMPTPKTIGGFRPNAGRSKHGYYKGIYCGSTYELCWVIYSIDHGIIFQRFPNCLKNNDMTYHPDFLLGDNKTIIEIKGYENTEQTEKRKKISSDFGYKFVMLKKTELQPMFDYVREKYKTKKFETLYDNYKPKYEYECKNCNVIFQKDKKIKTMNNFCSRSCTGNYNGPRNIKRG